MKKLYSFGLSLLVASMFLLFFSPQAHAITVTPADPCAPSTLDQTGNFNKVLCGLGTQNIGATIGSVLNVAFVIAVIIALFWLVWGGIKWILSGGDKTGVENARNHIIAAIIGLVIVFLAYFIITFLLGLFGLSLRSLEVPTVVPKPT